MQKSSKKQLTDTSRMEHQLDTDAVADETQAAKRIQFEFYTKMVLFW